MPWCEINNLLTNSIDGVAVVLYNMMNAFAEIVSTGEEVSGGDIALGLVSFFTIAFGGLTVGIIVGLLTALVTKTTTEVRGLVKFITNVP